MKRHPWLQYGGLPVFTQPLRCVLIPLFFFSPDALCCCRRLMLLSKHVWFACKVWWRGDFFISILSLDPEPWRTAKYRQFFSFTKSFCAIMCHFNTQLAGHISVFSVCPFTCFIAAKFLWNILHTLYFWFIFYFSRSNNTCKVYRSFPPRLKCLASVILSCCWYGWPYCHVRRVSSISIM